MKTWNNVEILETLAEILDPSHTALVVWDVQNGLVDHIFDREEFLPRLAHLVGSLRGTVPVIYTMATPLSPELRSGWSYLSQMRMFGVTDPAQLPDFMAPGSPEREIPEAVRPEAGDVVLEDSTPSIFLGTSFELMLRDRGVRTILFTGIATEVGIDHSAREAGARGFYPVVVTDCVSSPDREAHERSLATLGKFLAVTATSEEILAEMKPS
jgi:nicotinamidase-related amidase